MPVAPSLARSPQPAVYVLRRREHAPVIVGFDPGLRHTGYGVLRGDGPRARVHECGVFSTGARGDLGARLRRLHHEVEGLLREVRPDLVVLEDLFTHTRFPRTAIVLGHVRGVIWLAAASAGHRVLALAPSVVKRAVTGSGRASKPQVQAALCGLLGLRTLANAHAADALALAYAGLARGAGPRLGLEARR